MEWQRCYLSTKLLEKIIESLWTKKHKTEPEHQQGKSEGRRKWERRKEIVALLKLNSNLSDRVI